MLQVSEGVKGVRGGRRRRFPDRRLVGEEGYSPSRNDVVRARSNSTFYYPYYHY